MLTFTKENLLVHSENYTRCNAPNTAFANKIKLNKQALGTVLPKDFLTVFPPFSYASYHASVLLYEITKIISLLSATNVIKNINWWAYNFVMQYYNATWQYVYYYRKWVPIWLHVCIHKSFSTLLILVEITLNYNKFTEF